MFIDATLRVQHIDYQTDFMLPCKCSVIDHRWHQNVVRTKSDIKVNEDGEFWARQCTCNAKDELFNMTRAWYKENIRVPERNQTHDLPNTWQVLYPLNYQNSRRACWIIHCVMFNNSSFTIHYRAQNSPSLLTMNSTVLILAVYRAPVTYELS